MPKFVLQGRDDPRIAQLDEFTIAYIEAAFFTIDEDMQPAAVQQLSDETLARFVIDCAQFQRRAALDTIPEHACRRGTRTHSVQQQAGHDFWMNRNGHGVGFWDGDWAEPHADRLDRLSRTFGQVDLYRGDDGRIHH